MIHAGVVPQLAATVVLLRPGRTGLEVLLTRRPASMAFAIGEDRVIGGDLDGVIGARTIGGPADAVGTARSRARLATLVPGATWLSAHPA